MGEQLPLIVRKDIKESEPKIKEQLEKIKAIMGKEYTFDVDHKDLHGKVPADRKDTFPRFVVSYLAGFTKNLEKLCKDDSLARDVVNEVASTGKILFQIDEAAKGYSETKVVDGVITIRVISKNFPCNVDDTGKDFEASIVSSSSSTLPLLLRKNIRDAEKKKVEFLAKIDKATGQSGWTMDADMPTLYPKITAVDASRAVKLGTIIYNSYLENLASNLEAFCKDDMAKESFNGATKKHAIVFEINDVTKKYVDAVIKDDVIHLQVKPSNFWSNVGETGKDIEPQLTANSLPLVAAKNIRNAEPKKKEILARLDKATGQTGWTMDADIVSFYSKLPSSSTYNERAGAFIFNSYLNAITTHIEKLCKDEMSKEALNEVTKNHKIVFELVDNTKSYSDVSIKDGVIFIQVKPANFPSNVDDCGKGIEKLL